MKIKTNWKLLWGGILAVAWASLLYIFIKSNGMLTVEQIVNFHPESRFAAVLVMLGLFLLKSVDFLLYSGILYAACGIMFPLLPALFLNLAGVVIMLTIPYFVGKTMGPSLVEHLREKYSKIRDTNRLRDGGEIMIAVLLRAIGTPLHVASVYMGAVKYHYGRYLLGSLLGILPEMIAFTVMGMSASDVSSPAFRIALAAKLLFTAASIIIYAIMRKRSRGQEPV